MSAPEVLVCFLCSCLLVLDQRVGPPGAVQLVCDRCQPVFPELAAVPLEVDPLPWGPVDG